MTPLAPTEALDRRILSALYLRGAVAPRRLPALGAPWRGDELAGALARLRCLGALERKGRRVRLTPLGGKMAYALAGGDPRPLDSLLRDLDEELPGGGRLLDLGCGPGVHLIEAARGTMETVGIDRDAESLGLASAAVSAAAGRPAPLVRAAAESLPFRTGTFDRILCVVVLPYVRETPALREAARVLKQGGRMILTAHGAGYYLGLAAGRDVTLRRRLFGIVSLAGTITARMGLRLPGARFQTIGWIAAALRPAGVRVVRSVVAGRRWGAPVGLRLVLEKMERG